MWNKLPEDFKKQWVAALRSGKYSQTYGTLFSPEAKTQELEVGGDITKVSYEANSHCCLGVACAIVGISNEEMEGLGNPAALMDKFVTPETPDSIQARFKQIPLILREPTCEVDQLIHFNDEETWSFNKIADWIEENL